MSNTRLPSAGPRNAAKAGPADPSSPEAVLSKSQANREVIQDFVPLAESLEWDLGQQYLRERGNKAFISDASPVPFVINNDGTLSRNAAEVFFASLVEAEKTGPLEAEIFVLELGIGVGLFARYFLDNFRDLCLKNKKDYYDRLCYIAADKSRRMLLDVLRHGVLANHPGRYRVREVDALEPEKLLRDLMFRGQLQKGTDVVGGEATGGWHALRYSEGRGAPRPIAGATTPFGVPQGVPPAEALPQSGTDPKNAGGESPFATCKPLRAVFLNYVIDCLPVAALEIDGDQVKQLCVRMCVARNVNLDHHTDMSVEALRARAKSSDPLARQELLEVYGLFASEYDYRPVDIDTLPHGRFALEYGRRLTKRVLLNYGALQSLEKLLGMLHDQGFILINDYGQTQTTRDEEFEHQRFSMTTAVGLNFPLFKAFFGDGGKCQYLEPSGEERGIHSRLLGHKIGSDTITRFFERFGPAAHSHLEEPVKQARACVKVGRFELAAGFYREALNRQPRNWVLLNEISMFLTHSIRDPKAGIDMAKLALALNPTCSAELWNTLGDALFEFGRIAEAKAAYRKALAINTSDVRSRFNLARVHARERDYAGALAAIAEAMAHDKTGESRERLLQMQQEMMGRLALRNQQEYLLLINLVSKFAKQDGEPAKPAEAVKVD